MVPTAVSARTAGNIGQWKTDCQVTAYGRWRAISNDMNQSAVLGDVDGSMWFGASHGLSHLLDPSHLPPPSTLHPPLITNVSLGDKPLPYGL